MDLTVTANISKDSNMQKMLEKQRMCRSWRIFPHEQPLQTKTTTTTKKNKTVVDHSGNDHTILKSSNLSCILSCGLGH